MIAAIRSATVIGVVAIEVEVEVDLSRGLFVFSIVGLPASTVSEARTRVKSALKNTGYSFPKGRVSVNLAPAHVRKEGTAFDLPIALAILRAQARIPATALQDCLFIGELALDGRIRPVSGTLPVALLAKKVGIKRLFVPLANAQEVSIVEDVPIVGVSHLSQIVEALQDDVEIPLVSPQPLRATQQHRYDLSTVKGQRLPRRALEIAAAGGHNILFFGPPGTGKSLLAQCAATILPPMSKQEALETAVIESVSGISDSQRSLSANRPFRAPHHTVSDAALVGGGPRAKPGEVSLAHNGVLFLDELPEYRRSSIEALRQPLEDGRVLISRAMCSVEYPASFMLVAAMNPCPCGFSGDATRECQCHPAEIQRYQRKISGPLLDRFDVRVNVTHVPVSLLQSKQHGETSKTVRARVLKARTRQKNRASLVGAQVNRAVSPLSLTEHCPISNDASRVLGRAMEHYQMSARAFDRIRRVAWTIADLDESDMIRATHIAEAIQLRSKIVQKS